MSNIRGNYPLWQIFIEKVKKFSLHCFLSATRNKADFKTIRLHGLRKWCCISKRATVNWNWEFHLEIISKNQDPIHMIRSRLIYVSKNSWKYLVGLSYKKLLNLFSSKKKCKWLKWQKIYIWKHRFFPNQLFSRVKKGFWNSWISKWGYWFWITVYESYIDIEDMGAKLSLRGRTKFNAKII